MLKYKKKPGNLTAARPHKTILLLLYIYNRYAIDFVPEFYKFYHFRLNLNLQLGGNVDVAKSLYNA